MDGASWIADWWSWSLASTLQATLLLALAWLLDRSLARRAWPQLLLLFWLVALSRFFLPPDLRSPWSVTASLGAPTLAAAKHSPAASFVIAVFFMWLAGAAMILAARCVRRRRLRSRVILVAPSRAWQQALWRAARAMGTRSLPRLGTLVELGTPAVYGCSRPTLLLPREWLERAPTRRDEHALMHELAHLARRDPWLEEICAIFRAALWFHPLAWIALARVRELGELQCDQAVARALGSEARSYRDTLVLAAQSLVRRSTPAGACAFLGHPHALIVRIERLERGPARSTTFVRGVSAALVVALAACVLPMAPRALDLRAQAHVVLEAERRGELQSCFVLQAAAMVLAADSSH